MSQELTYHKVNGLNDLLTVLVLDQPGAGGAHHRYKIQPVEYANETDPAKANRLARAHCDIHFQNGPVQEVGVNGISIEALLTIVEHRLACFQTGDFACDENEVALMYTRAAIEVLHKRTLDRLQRGVEGTSQK